MSFSERQKRTTNAIIRLREEEAHKKKVRRIKEVKRSKKNGLFWQLRKEPKGVE